MTIDASIPANNSEESLGKSVIRLTGNPDAETPVAIEMDAYLALRNAGWRPPAWAPARFDEGMV